MDGRHVQDMECKAYAQNIHRGLLLGQNGYGGDGGDGSRITMMTMQGGVQEWAQGEVAFRGGSPEVQLGPKAGLKGKPRRGQNVMMVDALD